MSTTLGFVLAAAVSAVLFGLTGFYPPQSEDWIHLEIIASKGWLDAFDLSVSHSRPLWYLSLWSMLPEGLDHPHLMRLPLFAMHGIVGGLVGVLARALGASGARAFCAVALFLCFPAVKGLSWILAISTPLHVMLMFVALIATVGHVRRPRMATGLVILAAQVVAVLSHSAASILPFCVAFVAVGIAPKRWRALFDRWILAELVVGLGLVVLIACLPTEQRYHGLRSFGAIMANGSRALLSMVPEVIRGPAIAGLRGSAGSGGQIFGFAVCGAVAVGILWAFWKGNGIVRALMLAAAIDLAPPALTAGFVVRYAYFPAGLIAIALLLSARPTARWVVPIVLLGLGWAYDHGVDVAEVREGGRVGIAVVESARTVRHDVGPKRLVALLDAPGEVGAERDVPVFNWGLTRALRRNGVEGPFRVVRTVDYMTSSDAKKVDAAALEAMAQQGVSIWRWDPDAGQFVPR